MKFYREYQYSLHCRSNMTSTQTKIDYDKILKHIGQFGPWQIKIYFWLWLTSAAAGQCDQIWLRFYSQNGQVFFRFLNSLMFMAISNYFWLFLTISNLVTLMQVYVWLCLHLLHILWNIDAEILTVRLNLVKLLFQNILINQNLSDCTWPMSSLHKL